MAVSNVVVLGATGSIGTSTLDIIRRHPERYRLFAATAGRSVDQMVAICREFSPQYVVMSQPDAAQKVIEVLSSLGCKTEVLTDDSAQCEFAAHSDVDMVMAAIVGAAGLAPTLAAVKAGKKVLLANKESLVTAGNLFMDAVSTYGATLLPIDSEHNAIFQCLPNGKDHDSVKKILLTASGGPFRTRDISTFDLITPDEACAHPNWSMGRKISVDSASMMNKGLELIEACWLFGKDSDDIDVVVHPQSIVHSMVSYNDGSTIAQLGNPDMRTPIAYGMAWPERIDAGVELLDLITAKDLTFEAPDEQRFPLLALARHAWKRGGSAAAVMNAANEIAVDAFLNRRIGFMDIARTVSDVLDQTDIVTVESVDHVFDIDEQARRLAAVLVDTSMNS